MKSASEQELTESSDLLSFNFTKTMEAVSDVVKVGNYTHLQNPPLSVQFCQSSNYILMCQFADSLFKAGVLSCNCCVAGLGLRHQPRASVLNRA